MPDTPLTNAITALTTYANTVTGENDTDLSSAVATLCDGYGGGGTPLTIHNLLGDTTTFVEGYFASNGSTISAAGATSKDVTTDYIDIEDYIGEDLYLINETAGSITPWAAYTLYNSSKVLQGSRRYGIEAVYQGNFSGHTTGFTFYGQGSGAIASGQIIQIPSGMKYMRISFRTGGDGSISLIRKSEMDPLDYWTREIQEITIANKLVSDGTAT